jgi:hypothetical protein
MKQRGRDSFFDVDADFGWIAGRLRQATWLGHRKNAPTPILKCLDRATIWDLVSSLVAARIIDAADSPTLSSLASSRCVDCPS